MLVDFEIALISNREFPVGTNKMPIDLLQYRMISYQL